MSSVFQLWNKISPTGEKRASSLWNATPAAAGEQKEPVLAGQRSLRKGEGKRVDNRGDRPDGNRQPERNIQSQSQRTESGRALLRRWSLRITRRQAERELARRDLMRFAREVMPLVEDTPFHRTYYRVLQAFAAGAVRRLIVSVPPQHGKSLGSSVLLPAYLLGVRPQERIALGSYNFKLASRFNRRIQQLMQGESYRRIFPGSALDAGRRTGVVRTQGEFDLAAHAGGLLAVGREGSLTGNRVDVLILDDLYKDAMEANSPLVRENTFEWYNAVVRTRLHNASQELIVCTRWHEQDLIGEICRRERVVPLERFEQLRREGSEQEDEWLYLNFEAIKTGAPTPIDPRAVGEPLWRERHSLLLLEGRRRLDRQLFEALYQGRPATKEGLLYGEGFATYAQLPEAVIRRGNYTDTADAGEDFLCSVCFVTDTEGGIYVVDLLYTQEPMERTEGAVAEMLRRNDIREARIESNNGGRGFARAVGRLAPQVKIEWLHQSKNKEARILSNAATLLHSVRWPQGWQLRWPQLANELCTYRRVFRANRWHDAPDALTGVVEWEEERRRKTIRAVGFVG